MMGEEKYLSEQARSRYNMKKVEANDKRKTAYQLAEKQQYDKATELH